MIGKNKISGVVCEFNPLHNGHAALLSRISEEFGSDIVCVMHGYCRDKRKFCAARRGGCAR